MTKNKQHVKDAKPNPKCDNHPERDAVLTTDGTKFQVMNLCKACIPAHWK